MNHPHHTFLLSVLLRADDIHHTLHHMMSRFTALQRLEFIENLLKSMRYILSSGQIQGQGHRQRLQELQAELRKILTKMIFLKIFLE